MAVVIALDVGTKRIGVARGNTVSRISSPLVTITRKSVKKDSVRLAEIYRREGASKLVVGLPYQLDGQEGRLARLSRQVGEALAGILEIDVHYHDERYSTVEAQRRMKEVGKSFKKRSLMIDEYAAAVILEDWMNDLP